MVLCDVRDGTGLALALYFTIQITSKAQHEQSDHRNDHEREGVEPGDVVHHSGHRLLETSCQLLIPDSAARAAVDTPANVAAIPAIVMRRLKIDFTSALPSLSRSFAAHAYIPDPRFGPIRSGSKGLGATSQA